MIGLLVGALLTIVALLVRQDDAGSLGLLRESGDENGLAQLYGEVDFGEIYPDMTPEEIDELQRACLGIRYRYEPFVQFLPEPVSGEWLNISEHGVRSNGRGAPWPPDPRKRNIFVFGGSTTLGYHLRDDQTLPAYLEIELRSRLKNTHLNCYNLGSGFYFSSQERARFAALLAEGVVPQAAIFVDGFNDFAYPRGNPQFTYNFFNFSAADTKLPERFLVWDRTVVNDNHIRSMVDSALARYLHNLRLISSMGQEFGVDLLFVGQPVPYSDYPIGNAKTYPFRSEYREAEVRMWTLGYPRFEQMARAGVFGQDFIWTGDAFRDAKSSMYADKLHYSPEGARILARLIVDRALRKGFLAEMQK